MRRVAVRALRSTCQSTVRGLSRGSRTRLASLVAHHYHHQLRPLHTSPSLSSSLTARAASPSSSSLSQRQPQPPHQYALAQPLRSSMYIRRFSVALVSGLVGYGAWYGFKGNATDSAVAQYSTSGTARLTSENAAPTRNVLVVGADELHTGTFVGEGPIAKSADGSDSNVLEMLTPDQATEKLRDNQASFLVNRGQGVLRYDVVQLASNNPIEDDHAEKIVEVAGDADHASKDWMFWGVFDGHACVSPPSYVSAGPFSLFADMRVAVVGRHRPSCVRP
jgi:pyruvate dehydrogenase phosphatase